MSELFIKIEQAAHSGAFGQYATQPPSEAQCRAGNYKLGRITLYGLPIAIEQPRGSYRTGTDAQGARWSSRMAAHYGYISGTKGNDGDCVDCFVGYYPQATTAFVINQNLAGRFDEHKVMLGFPDHDSACRAYLDSYERGWSGLASSVPLSIPQLKWWLKKGDLSRPLHPDDLPPEGLETMTRKVQWNADALPYDFTLDQVLYAVRRADHGEGLLLDAVTAFDVLDDADGSLTFDALVSPYAKLEQKMKVLRDAMIRVGTPVKPVAFQITDPFKQRGVANVAVIFELSDGQTITLFLHNPDTTPSKISPTDEVISWKWLLNKKDITIVVAPERGEDLNVREVARRIMRLADKNSAAFQRANANRAERMQRISDLEAECSQLEQTLADLLKQIELAEFEAEQRAGLPEQPLEPAGTEALIPEGATNTIKTAKGTKVETGFTVLEADQIIVSHDKDGNPNPEYPAELQPRDRSRTASQAWVQKTAKTLDPDSLGRTSRADSGAPIIGPDRVVESGNGRTMAIIEAYRQGTAEEYRAWLIEGASYFGLDSERIRAMKAPILLRVRTSEVDRRAFAIEANQDDKLAMTGTEKARADADRLDRALLSKLSDEGNLLASSNLDFVKGFLASLGDAEAAQYMTSAGQPTGALIARIQAAIFAKAYSDDRLLELTADSSKPEVANIIEALNISAPEFILAQAADAQGVQGLTAQLVDSVEVSLNQQAVEAIIEATNLVRKARAEGTSVEEAVSQRGLFGDMAPATAAMALFINKNNRSAKRLGAAFKAMAQFVRQEAERGQSVDLFGDDASKTGLQQVIEAANRQLEKEYGEGAYAIEALDLFSPAKPPEQPEAIVLTGKELGDFPDTPEGKKALRKAAIDMLLKLRGDWVDCPALNAQVEIRKRGVNKIRSTSADPLKLKVIPAIREILASAIKIRTKPNYDSENSQNILAYHVLRAAVVIGSEEKGVRIVVSEDDKGLFHYDHTLLATTAIFDSVESKSPTDAGLSWLMGGNLGCTYNLRAVPEATSLLPLELSNRHQLGHSATLDDAGQVGSGQYVINLFIEGEPPEFVEVEVEPDSAPDTAFLQSVIDGTVADILAPELGSQIGAVYERNIDNPQILPLIEQAVMAYQRAMEQATSSL